MGCGQAGKRETIQKGKDLEQMPEIGKAGVERVWGIKFKSW